jgi:hypothetical protein
MGLVRVGEKKVYDRRIGKVLSKVTIHGFWLKAKASISTRTEPEYSGRKV